MKVGDKVKIYKRPLTKEGLEGVAELIQKCYGYSNKMEVWQVRFISEEEVFVRTILKDNIN